MKMLTVLTVFLFHSFYAYAQGDVVEEVLGKMHEINYKGCDSAVRGYFKETHLDGWTPTHIEVTNKTIIVRTPSIDGKPDNWLEGVHTNVTKHRLTSHIDIVMGTYTHEKDTQATVTVFDIALEKRDNSCIFTKNPIILYGGSDRCIEDPHMVTMLAKLGTFFWSRTTIGGNKRDHDLCYPTSIVQSNGRTAPTELEVSYSSVVEVWPADI